MLEPIVFLILGFIGTLFVGGAGRFLSTRFVDKRLTRVVGFSIAIGFVFAGGFRGVETNSDLQQAMLSIGMVAGLGLLWFRYFKSQKAER